LKSIQLNLNSTQVACIVILQIWRVPSACFSSLNQRISPNFNLKIMISIYAKDFSWNKWPKFTRFWNFLLYFFQIARFLW
jgi:hypothetical protein